MGTRGVRNQGRGHLVSGLDGAFWSVVNERGRRIYRAVDYTSVTRARRKEYDMSLGSYGRLATEAYDIDKPVGHSFGDVEFYLKRLKSCTGRVLEPAVGTGRC
jgi:hypothetical protein